MLTGYLKELGQEAELIDLDLKARQHKTPEFIAVGTCIGSWIALLALLVSKRPARFKKARALACMQRTCTRGLHVLLAIGLD